MENASKTIFLHRNLVKTRGNTEEAWWFHIHIRARPVQTVWMEQTELDALQTGQQRRHSSTHWPPGVHLGSTCLSRSQVHILPSAQSINSPALI
jgi:hypothetical protein